jgi:hypothetical protein
MHQQQQQYKPLDNKDDKRNPLTATTSRTLWLQQNGPPVNCNDNKPNPWTATTRATI